MKASVTWVTAILFIVICVFWTHSAQAGSPTWPNTKGEICIHVIQTNEFVRLAVAKTLGSHYIVHGLSTDLEGGAITLLNGNAEVHVNQILMNITGSGYVGGEVHGGFVYVELDATTLAGEARAFGFHCEGDPADNNCGFAFDGIQDLEPAVCP